MGKRSEADTLRLVEGAGFAASLWAAVQSEVEVQGGSGLDIHRLVTPEGADTLRKMVRVTVLRGECEIVPVVEAPVAESTTHSITVDYGQSLEEMVAAGRYDSRNNDITQEHFPLQGTGRVEMELHLVHLKKVAGTDEVLAELDRRNLRPATLPELLAFGAKYPDLQREFPIVALGSVWQDPFGFRDVACLDHWHGERYLRLYWVEGVWRESFRFAAVSK